MERSTTRPRPGPGRSIVLPSRAEAIAACREAVERGGGPLLITGEPGVGKSWLWAQLADSAVVGRWLGVDLPPAAEPHAWLADLARALGRPSPATADAARRAVEEALADRARDGRRVVAVIDEAHNATDRLLEELRVASNGLARADGLAGLVLVGQPPLAARLRCGAPAALASRLSARIHLRPLDVVEARSLLESLDPVREWPWSRVERLHRDAEGNPSRLLRLAGARRPATPRPTVAAHTPATTPRAVAAPAPELLSTRPPLRVEEGLVEVGWAGEPSEPPMAVAVAVAADRAAVVPEYTTEPVPIDDHYASLQARAESLANRPVAAEAAAAWSGPSSRSPLAVQVRAERQHGHAPYGPIFARHEPGRAEAEGDE